MDLLNQRNFIKTFVLAGFGTAFCGKTIAASGEISVQATTPATGGVRINITSLAALKTDGGSMLLTVPSSNSTLDLIVTRQSANQYFAVSSICTHQQCQLPPFDKFTNLITCLCHGSQYKVDGTLVFGAIGGQASLPKFAAVLETPSVLRIDIPGLGYTTSQALVHSAVAGDRVQLTFAVGAHFHYEVRFKGKLSDPWVRIPFSTTLDGPAISTSLTPTATPATVYVDRVAGAGFYLVSKS